MKKVLISFGEMVTVKASSPQLRHLLSSEIKKTQTTRHVKGMRGLVFRKMLILT